MFTQQQIQSYKSIDRGAAIGGLGDPLHDYLQAQIDAARRAIEEHQKDTPINLQPVNTGNPISDAVTNATINAIKQTPALMNQVNEHNENIFRQNNPSYVPNFNSSTSSTESGGNGGTIILVSIGLLLLLASKKG